MVKVVADQENIKQQKNADRQFWNLRESITRLIEKKELLICKSGEIYEKLIKE